MLERLQAAIEQGLSSDHDLSGRVAVRWGHDGFTLVLEPGRVAFEPGVGAAGADATVDIKQLEPLLSQGPSTDIRAPELEHWVAISGDGELAANAVLLSLQRPPPGVALMFKTAENRSRLRQVTLVERVPRPSLEEVRQRVNEGVPFIATGALEWRALAEPLDAFLQRHGAVELPPALGHSRETLEAFVQRVRSGATGRSYTLGVALPEALVSEFPPAYGDASLLTPPQLWFGAGRDARLPITPLHRDLMCGFLGHVYGRKRFVMFAPHQSDAVYARSSFHFFQTCWATPHRPDFVRYPKLREATPLELVLEPGELLVQPAGWFHSVFCLDGLTMSISYFA